MIYLFILYMHCCFCLRVCLCEGIKFPGTAATDYCELPRRCWEWNLDPLIEHSVFLTVEL